MKPNRIIRTPYGHLHSNQIDTLRLDLKSRSELLLKSVPVKPSPPVEAPTQGQMIPTYATDSFDIRENAGAILTQFGAGSVGGFTVWAVGPGRLTIYLIDNKSVETKHTQAGRTIYDPAQVGQLKVHALKEKIEGNYIGTTIHPMPYDVAELPDHELLRLFGLSVITILAIDDPVQMLRINTLAYSRIPIVQVGIHRQGASGHIALSLPGITPCLACTLDISSAQDIRRLDSEPAAGLDIAIISQMAARIALDLIYSAVTGKPITRWDPVKNLILVSNTQQDISPEGPGIQYQAGHRRHGCPVCS